MTQKQLLEKLGAFICCSQLISKTSGNAVENQFVLTFKNGVVFQSYQTMIAAKIDGKLYLSNCHDCSNTTSKYCGQWTGYTAKERRKMIDNGKVEVFE